MSRYAGRPDVRQLAVDDDAPRAPGMCSRVVKSRKRSVDGRKRQTQLLQAQRLLCV